MIHHKGPKKPRQIKKDAKSFIASVRIDIRHLASIAKFLNSKGIRVETGGRIASEAIKVLASLTFEQFPVLRYEDAVLELMALTDEDLQEKNTKYYTALSRQLELEKIKETERSMASDNVAWHQAEDDQKEADRQKAVKQGQAAMDAMEGSSHSPIAPDKPPADIQEIDQRSSEDLKDMRAGLGTPDVETAD